MQFTTYTNAMLPHTSKQLFSEAGTITLVPASNTITGEFVAIQCLSTTVFTTLTDAVDFPASTYGGAGASVAATQTYPAGFILYGRFTAIRLTSGAVRVTLASNRT
jgi:hypothetical protein